MKIVLLLVIAALIIGGVLFHRVYKENRRSIDCGMHAANVAMIALKRDKGATREQARAEMGVPPFDTYSPEQREAVLDAVYLHGVGKSFEEIRTMAWEQCDKNPVR